MSVIRRILLHLENNEKYAVVDSDNGYYLYFWSYEDIPSDSFSLKDYMAKAVIDFARYQKRELANCYSPITTRDLRLYSNN